MLIQLVVKNFLSFRDETVFRMTATNDTRHPDHVLNIESQKISLLRSAAIYGANGAGKTNLVTALAFMKRLLVNGVKPKTNIGLRRFKLDDESERSPAKFEIEILKNGIRYSYGILLDDTRIHEEWLFSTKPDGGREARLFERVTSKDGTSTIEFGPQLKENGEDFLLFLAKGTRPEQPFISEAESRNVKQIQPVLDWFRDTLSIIRTSTTYRPLAVRLGKDKNFADSLGKFLKAAGTGIEAVEANEEALDFDKHFPGMPQALRDDLLTSLDGKANMIILGPEGPEDDFTAISGNRDNPKLLKLHTVHGGNKGERVSFRFAEESSGTKRLIHLFPALFALTQEGKVFVVDELDRSMHPLLSRLFFQTFLETASKSGQLIFTTHEECLLDLDLIRRDEIWFIEKDKTESSHCYPLTDFKIRPDVEIRKGYLNGRFGAIPFFGDIASLGWSAG